MKSDHEGEVEVSLDILVTFLFILYYNFFKQNNKLNQPYDVSLKRKEIKINEILSQIIHYRQASTSTVTSKT